MLDPCCYGRIWNPRYFCCASHTNSSHFLTSFPSLTRDIIQIIIYYTPYFLSSLFFLAPEKNLDSPRGEWYASFCLKGGPTVKPPRTSCLLSLRILWGGDMKKGREKNSTVHRSLLWPPFGFLKGGSPHKRVSAFLPTYTPP